MTKQITLSAKATVADVQNAVEGDIIPVFDVNSPHILGFLHDGLDIPGGDQVTWRMVVSQPLTDSWVAANGGHGFVTTTRPNGSSSAGPTHHPNSPPTEPAIIQPENKIFIGLVSPIELNGSGDLETTIVNFTVEASFDETTLGFTLDKELFLVFDEPASYVQNQILTPKHNIGFSEIKVIDDHIRGVFVRCTFDTPFTDQQSYVVVGQYEGVNQDTWCPKDYDEWGDRQGSIRLKRADYVEVWMRKSGDLATLGGTISLHVRGG
jgi:hypothetical protein